VLHFKRSVKEIKAAVSNESSNDNARRDTGRDDPQTKVNTDTTGWKMMIFNEFFRIPKRRWNHCHWWKAVQKKASLRAETPPTAAIERRTTEKDATQQVLVVAQNGGRRTVSRLAEKASPQLTLAGNVVHRRVLLHRSRLRPSRNVPATPP
jgi:hypothetical protein